MHHLRLGQAALFGSGVVLAGVESALQALRLRRRLDGWRRSAGLVLRGMESTFVLSAFGLRLPGSSTHSPEALLLDGLRSFFEAESIPRVRVRRGTTQNCPEAFPSVSFSLGFEQWADDPARFIRPARWDANLRHTDATPEHAVMVELVARVSPDRCVDLWGRVNHVAIDGAAMQESFTRLEQKWGSDLSVKFPSVEAFGGYQGPRSVEGREDLEERQAFVDFSRLIDWRGKANKLLPEPMTLSAAFLWCLSRHTFFAPIQMGTTVDIPPVAGLGRGVGVISIRPAGFPNTVDGLRQYVARFNQEMRRTRERRSRGCRLLDATAALPARCARALLHRGLLSGKPFGSLAVSMLKDARVFGAAIGEVGHADGFIAIGSVALDAQDGRKVGCVSIKAPSGSSAHHFEAIRSAIDQMQQCPIVMDRR